jgi:hypothetical protein
MVRRRFCLYALALFSFAGPALASDAIDYDSSVYCRAIYAVAMNAEDMLEHPRGDLFRRLETYQEHATGAAQTLGRRKGKSADQINGDFSDALDEARGNVLDGKFSFEKIDQYRRVCDQLIDEYGQRR